MEKKHKKCEEQGFSGDIEFGKILSINLEEVEIKFKERCQSCLKIVNKGSIIYTYKTTNVEI